MRRSRNTGRPVLLVYGYNPQITDEFREALRRRLLDHVEEEDTLYCFLCGTAITREAERVTMQGSHEHTFTNPGGYVYQIGCFRRAPGCEQVGAFTEEHTWFPGYSWRYAVCGSCGTHLGWTYSSAGRNEFYGLIVDRLLSSSAKRHFPGTN